MIAPVRYAPLLRRSLLIGSIGLSAFLLACEENEAYTEASAEGYADFASQVGTWFEALRAEKLADIDRDYVYCLGPDDPVPLATAVPDASGHSRARVTCAEAAERVREKLDRYDELIEQLKAVDPGDEKPIREVYDQLVEIYSQRLDLYQDIVRALEAGDDAELSSLRERNIAVAEAEAAAPELVAALAPP